MSKDINDGGPAFPRPASETDSWQAPPQQGMSLRDYFAAAALTGILAACEDVPESKAVATEAFNRADAMIRERSK